MRLSKKESDAADALSRLIYRGANISELEKLFNLDHRMITARLAKAGIKPAYREGRGIYYKISEAAPHIIKPALDVETYLKQMDPRELPKMLTKEFWAAMKSRQDYEERRGDLWPTQKVVEEVGELFKIIKMSLLLMVDGVERTTELSEKQRELVKSMTHGLLDELTRRIEERFVVQEEDDRSRMIIEVEQQEDNERQEAQDDEEL